MIIIRISLIISKTFITIILLYLFYWICFWGNLIFGTRTLYIIFGFLSLGACFFLDFRFFDIVQNDSVLPSTAF